MPKYNAYVPVDMKIEVEAASEGQAAGKALAAEVFFVGGAGAYKLNVPGIGPVVITLERADLEDEADRYPYVEEIKSVATTNKAGALPTPADYAAPFEGTSLIPKDHPSQTKPSLGGVKNGEEWGA